MQTLISILHVLIAFFVVVLVLLQHGKGADAGAAFGSGASSTMFGSAGVTPFLVKVTTILAAGFFATSIGLSYLAAHQSKAMDELMMGPKKATVAAPPAPVSQ